MSNDKLSALRQRTTLVKAHNALEKRGGIERVLASLMKGTKTSGNALVSSKVNNSTSDRPRKSDGFLKTASIPPSTARGGQGITAMGAGMAPFQFRAQPEVAAQSKEIAGRDLKNAWPGLAPATKSTSPMKRNAGSIMASAKRQTGKKAKGELVSPAAALTAAPVADKTVLGSVSVEGMEKQAVLGLIRGIPAAWKAWRAARTLNKATKATQALANATSRGGRILPHATATGPRLAADGTAKLQHVGNALRSGEFSATPLVDRVGSKFFQSGIGAGRNIFQRADGSKFIGGWNPLNYIPGVGGRTQQLMMNRAARKAGLDGGIKLVRTGANTGGYAQRAAKGMARGYGLGATGGYLSSFGANRNLDDAGLFDKRRLAIANQWGTTGMSLGGGGMPGFIAGSAASALDPTNSRTSGPEAWASLAEQGRMHSGARSKMQAVTNARGETQRARRRAAVDASTRLRDSANTAQSQRQSLSGQ